MNLELIGDADSQMAEIHLGMGEVVTNPRSSKARPGLDIRLGE